MAKFKAIAGFTAGLMLLTSTAFADNLLVDGDDLAAGTNFSVTGEAACTEPTPKTGDLEIRRTGNVSSGQVFSNSEALTITRTITGPNTTDVSSDVVGTVANVPAAWQTSANNTRFKIADISTTVAAGAANGIYTVEYKAVGQTSTVELSNSFTVTVNLSCTPTDETAPESTLTATVPGDPDPVPYATDTWTNKTVTVEITAEDNLGGSGVKEIRYTVNDADTAITAGTVYSTPLEFSTDGTSAIRYAAIDNENNVETVKSFVVKVDKTPPTSVVGGVTEGAVYVSAPTVSCTATDQVGLSGVATHGIPSGNTTTPGAKSVSCNGATDNAGNVQTTASAVVNYTLAPIGGFNSNFDGNAVLKVKPNQAVPLKWAFNDGTENLALLSGATLNSVTSNRCTSIEGVDTPGETAEIAAGASGLQLLPDNSYQINWKAVSTTGCRALTVNMTLTGGGTFSRTILVNIAR